MRYHISHHMKILTDVFDLEIKSIFRRANLSLESVTNEEAQVSEETMYALWLAVTQEAAHAGYENFELSLAQKCLELPLEPAIYAFSCGETVLQGFQRLAKYKPLVGPFALSVSVQNGDLVLEFTSQSRKNKLPKSLALFETIFALLIARRFSGTDIQPLRFEHEHALEHTKGLGALLSQPTIASERTRLVFSAADANLPLITRSPQMWMQIEPMLEARLEQAKSTHLMSMRVQHALEQIMPAGNVSSDIVAKRLAVSKRTLQRRLNEEGTNFQMVLKNLRLDLSKRYLRESAISVPEISLLLEFQDTNSFFRAFRSWTNTTPSAYRHAEAWQKETLVG